MIGQIFVADGSHVVAGDLLVKLDETQAHALLGIVTSQLTELIGRKARLAAERDDRDDLEFPPGFAQGGPEEERVASGERRLFQARLASANGQKAQLEERIKQNEEEIKGLTLQNTAKARELALIAEELSRVDELYKKKLLPVTRVLSLQRDEGFISRVRLERWWRKSPSLVARSRKRGCKFSRLIRRGSPTRKRSCARSKAASPNCRKKNRC